MNFEGSPVKKIGTIEIGELKKLENQIIQKYSNHWKARSLKIFTGLSTLKAITPTKLDRTHPEIEVELQNLLLPFVQPYVGANEKIVYLDVSRIPPNGQTEVHYDFAWIHVLSRRIVIPLKVSDKTILGVLDESHRVKTFNLKLGHVYEFNNQLLHAAANYGTEDRLQIIVDIMDLRAYEYLAATQNLDKTYCGKMNVFYLDKAITHKIQKAMIRALEIEKSTESYEIS